MSQPREQDEKAAQPLQPHKGDIITMYDPPKPVSVEVSSTITADDDRTPYTKYVILVKWRKDNAWTVMRRFSEFEALQKALSERMSNLPQLPAKTWFRSLAVDFIATRQRQLNEYLQQLQAIPAVLHTKVWRDFLDISDNVQFGGDLLPWRVATVADSEYGVNAFHFDVQEKLLFTACEDVSLLSVLDAKISNIKLPWEKDAANRMVPVGSFSVWRLVGEVWEVVLTEYLDSKVSALAWDRLRQYLYIGLDNGRVQAYMVDVAKKLTNRVQDDEVHAARVTSLIFDYPHDYLISVSNDKTVNVMRLQDRAIISNGGEAKGWLSSMAYDTTEDILFAGSYNRTVDVFDTSKNPPALISTLRGHDGSVRCIYFAAKERYLFSGGFDNMIGIWHIPKGAPSRARSVGWLKSGPPAKVKAVIFCSSLNLVVAGYETGFLAVFEVREGKLLFVWRGHEKDIFCMDWLDAERLLISSGHDGDVKFWQFPHPKLEENLPRAPSSHAGKPATPGSQELEPEEKKRYEYKPANGEQKAQQSSEEKSSKPSSSSSSSSSKQQESTGESKAAAAAPTTGGAGTADDAFPSAAPSKAVKLLLGSDAVEVEAATPTGTGGATAVGSAPTEEDNDDKDIF